MWDNGRMSDVSYGKQHADALNPYKGGDPGTPRPKKSQMALYKEITMRQKTAHTGRFQTFTLRSGFGLGRVGYVAAAMAVALVAVGAMFSLLSRPTVVHSDAAAGPGGAPDDGAPAPGQAESPPSTAPVDAEPVALCGSTLPAEMLLFADEDPELVSRVDRIDDDGRLVHTASFGDYEIAVTWPMGDRAEEAQVRPDWDQLGDIEIMGAAGESARSFLAWHTDRSGIEAWELEVNPSGDIEITGMDLEEGPCARMSIQASVAGEKSAEYGFDFSDGDSGSPVRINRDPLVGESVADVEPPPIDTSFDSSCPASSEDVPLVFFETPEDALEAQLITQRWADNAGFTQYAMTEDQVAYALPMGDGSSDSSLFVFDVERHDEGWAVVTYHVSSGC
jgi:hypothetical protein